MHRLPSDTLVIATHNAGKVREFKSMLSNGLPRGINKIISAAELNLPEPEETGLSFADNALIKAQAAAKSGHLALADDSGLCVKVLSGEPGIFSARWAGPEKNFAAAMHRIHDEMGAAADRAAWFICVLALAWPDGHTEYFEGRVDGHIAWPPRGDKGHGYDPIFVPQNEMRSFAEMPEDKKNAISHRGVALQKLMHYFK